MALASVKRQISRMHRADGKEEVEARIRLDVKIGHIRSYQISPGLASSLNNAVEERFNNQANV